MRNLFIKMLFAGSITLLLIFKFNPVLWGYIKRFFMKTTDTKNYTEEDAKIAILSVKNKFGLDMAQTVEKMLRLETNHFKSGQFKRTGSAGMETGKWSNINPNEIEKNVYQAHDSNKSDGIDNFIIWKSPTFAALYLADYIKRHGGNYARWYSLNTTSQQEYRNKINQIKSKFV